jgi:IS5 family transposase
MAYRVTGQLAFSDLEVGAGSGSAMLRRLDAIVDWGRFDDLLRRVVLERSRGAAAYPPLLMFRALLLQRWYSLSDPQLEEALNDRVSFKRFVGLSMSDAAPDHSTIWRFRERLEQSGLDVRLGEELQRQLAANRLIVRSGTLVDASLIGSAAARPAERGSTRSEVDPDARWGKKGKRSTFGYKMHVAVDEGSLLVRDVIVSEANHNDCEFTQQLVQGDESCLIADKAYHDKKVSKELKRRGIKDGIMRRGNKHYAQSKSEVRRNKKLAPRRSPVESVFGTLKRCYGLARMRCFTMARNTTDVLIGCIAYNLRRMVSLMPI